MIMKIGKGKLHKTLHILERNESDKGKPIVHVLYPDKLMYILFILGLSPIQSTLAMHCIILC